ncbi:hypothetical protein [Gordonia sp. FQ]|uniref:hypothetical protein n=1 Tax=Gordonia sp. FQ TaxID=3446634 RepID=UPI003F86D1A9
MPRRSGDEQLVVADGVLGPTLRDFWAWSSSDLLSNTLRGVLSEFLVGTALGCIGEGDTRLEWDQYDLKTADGTSIEVKSTARLQSWGPTKPGSMSFGIGRTQAWNARTNEYSTERKRQADVYVFCVFIADDRTTANPLDTGQWEFYVAATRTLDARFPEHKSIAISTLRAAPGVQACGFTTLKDAVTAANTEP